MAEEVITTDATPVVPATETETPVQTEQVQEVPEVEVPEFQPPPIPGNERASSGDPEQELAWLRMTWEQQQAELQRMRAELDEYRYAGLDPEEATAQRLAEREAQLNQREQATNDAQVRQQWYSYFSGWIPEADRSKLLTGSDVVQWNHQTLSYMEARARKAEAELSALKKATTKAPAQIAPAVTASGSAPSPRRSVFDIPLKELQQLKERAKRGLLDREDVPGLGE